MIEQFEGYLFDLDGVITPTVDLHRRAWHETFDAVFARHSAPPMATPPAGARPGALLGSHIAQLQADQTIEPYREDDYFESLDGRPRFDGVRVLLASRGLVLPEGEPDANDLDTVHGIGNRKNQVFTEVLERDGIAPYPGSMALIERLQELGKPLAVVSSSRNAEAVLRAAGIRDLFAVVVDGVVAANERLPGKPSPETFLRAAELLGAAVARSVVFEDAASGVAAGRAGGFDLVIGVDRGAGAELLEAAGAHTVVTDLGELL